MIDQISKLKDHVNVSIMKAVQDFKLINRIRRIQCVDCVVWESHCIRTAIPIKQYLRMQKLYWRTWKFIKIKEIYRQFKSDCCGGKPILLLNGEWDIFGCFSIFFPSLKLTYTLFYVRSKRYILHVPSLKKFVQPFKCYQIILLSLTCQLIPCWQRSLFVLGT
jgi:hypothetical protein